jgi:hypothetical protein
VQTVVLRSYDEVLGQEYQTYTKQANFMSKMFKSQAAGAEGGDTLVGATADKQE